MLKLEDRIKLLAQLGKYIKNGSPELNAIKQKTYLHNPWFTIENIDHALEAIATSFLQEDKLTTWVSQYEFIEQSTQNIGLVMADTIPLVGFHDVLCIFLSGHRAKIKLSEKDKYLLPHLIESLEELDPRIKGYFEYQDQLKDFDGIIASGGKDSIRYFETYFKKYPHIIRRQRTSVAVLDGNESEDDLFAFGKDVFRYFGLGDRNVSKLYLPRDYDFNPLLEALHEYKEIVLHNKYKNNLDYDFTLYILNKTPFKNNGCVLLKEDAALFCRIATLNYEFYDDLTSLEVHLKSEEENIQNVVSHCNLNEINSIPLGFSQYPSLTEYANNIDTIQFLLNLKISDAVQS